METINDETIFQLFPLTDNVDSDDYFDVKTIKEKIFNTIFKKENENIVIERIDSLLTANIAINYQVADTLLGEIMLASSNKGVCYAGFTNGNPEASLKDLQRRFSKAIFIKKTTIFQQEALARFNDPQEEDLPLHLHLQGTEFQLSIWRKLLKVPYGGLTTYTQLGGSTKLARAVGGAVGDNPICYLIPCHRVVRSSGRFYGYFWGNEQKKKLLAMEAKALKPDNEYSKKRV
jgi:AraC family transcriptional regulator, regulatory protein of adaptative response / methylated-DNA-[protein]-cysteine methyltransferase